MNRKVIITLMILWVVIGVTYFWYSRSNQYDQRLVITDVNKPQVIMLHALPGQKHINSLGIRGTVNINGKARVMCMTSEYVNISGKSRFNQGGEWYTTTAELSYEPLNVQSGTIVIEYSFTDLHHGIFRLFGN
jgi:hypothetical protein